MFLRVDVCKWSIQDCVCSLWEWLRYILTPTLVAMCLDVSQWLLVPVDVPCTLVSARPRVQMSLCHGHRSPVGVPESTPQLFGNSWKTLSACAPLVPGSLLDPCDVHLQAGEEWGPGAAGVGWGGVGGVEVNGLGEVRGNLQWGCWSNA